MARGVLITFSNPRDESVEDEYNRYYEMHIQELVDEHPAVVSVSRYRALTPDAKHRYVAVLEMESDDIPGVITALREASLSGRTTRSDTVADVAGTLWERISVVSR